MQFVEIKEPEYVIGIDLGTTNSLVALKMHDTTQILPDRNGNKILPSVVFYNEEESKTKECGNFISSFKRLMGKNIEEAREMYFPFTLLQENEVKIKIGDKKFTAIELSAIILKKLKKIAEDYLETKISKTVITIPAYFNEVARLATKKAAAIAELEVMRLLNEPTAAALAYNIDRRRKGVYMVYDLGGGTFDVSILKMHERIFQVISTGGDTTLGGDSLDYAIACDILESKKQKANNREMRIILRNAKNARETLTKLQEVTICVTIGDHAYEHVITREHFNKLATSYIDKTIKIVDRAIRDAGIRIEDIQGIILVGGATRTPRRKEQRITKFGDIKIFDDLNPEEVVAMGAAEQAHSLIHGSNNLLLDITPLSLGIETIDGLCEVIIQRNTSIPASQSQLFTTQKDNQTSIMMHICQGESSQISNNKSLAKFELKNIPPMPAGKAKIIVTFTIDTDGLLKVTAKEENTGIEQSIHVNHICGLHEAKSILESSHNT